MTASAMSAQMRCATARRFVLVDRWVMPGGSDCRDASRPVNDDGAEIVNVGGGRCRREEIAKPREKTRGIVLGEKGGRIEAEGLRTRRRGGVDQGARRIVRAAA